MINTSHSKAVPSALTIERDAMPSLTVRKELLGKGDRLRWKGDIATNPYLIVTLLPRFSSCLLTWLSVKFSTIANFTGLLVKRPISAVKNALY